MIDLAPAEEKLSSATWGKERFFLQISSHAVYARRHRCRRRGAEGTTDPAHGVLK